MYFGGKQGSLSPNGISLRQGVRVVDDRWGCRYSADAVLAAMEKRAGWYAEGYGAVRPGPAVGMADGEGTTKSASGFLTREGRNS